MINLSNKATNPSFGTKSGYKFISGQKVRCVDNSGYESTLVLHKVYTVDSYVAMNNGQTYKDIICLKEISGYASNFFDNRFVPIPSHFDDMDDCVDGMWQMHLPPVTKCTCGAAHTSFPNHHLKYCILYKEAK